jgi:uncharacterized repeat protein (TIGR02543 family)
MNRKHLRGNVQRIKHGILRPFFSVFLFFFSNQLNCIIMKTKILHQIRRLFAMAATFLVGSAGAHAYDYTDYDYVEEFNSPSTLTTKVEGKSNRHSYGYDQNGSSSDSLFFHSSKNTSGDASGSARGVTYIWGQPISFQQKAIVEFDLRATKFYGGTNGTDEYWLSFQNSSGQALFTIYTVAVSSSGTGNIGVVAGPWTGAAAGSTSGEITVVGAAPGSSATATNKLWINETGTNLTAQISGTPPCFHIKAEIDVENKKVNFTITKDGDSYKKEIELPYPEDFVPTNVSQFQFTYTRGANVYFTWQVDNIGIKNADPQTDPSIMVNEINITGPEYVALGKTAELTAEVLPLLAGNKALAWSSSNTALATVDAATGVVVGVAASASSADKVTITATAQDGGGAIGTFQLLVVPQPATGITLQGVHHAFYTDNPAAKEPFTITATVAPDDAADKTISWSSSSTGIATVAGEAGGTASVTLVGGTGRTTITAAVTDIYGYGASANYTLDVAGSAAAGSYSGYDYVDLLTNAGMNGSITHEGNGALLAYEVNSGADYRLRFSGSAQSGLRRSIYTLSEPVLFYQKAVVEFDFFSNNHTGGASGDEGQVTFRDFLNNDVFTVYNINGTTNTLGVAVGALTGTGDTRRANSVAEAQRATFAAPAAAWYHVKAEVQLVADDVGDPRVAFTITGVTDKEYEAQTVTLPFPSTFFTYGGLSNIFFCATRTSANMSWDASVDNIGIKKEDQTTPGQKINRVDVLTSSDTVVLSKTLQLSATTAPADAENPTFTWSSSNESYVTVNRTGLVTGVTLTDDAIPVYVRAVANDGGGAKDSTRVHVINQKVTGVTLSGTVHNIYTINAAAEPPFTVTAVVLPNDAHTKTLAWTCNPAIAAISSPIANATGDTITVSVQLAGGMGRDTIRATTTDGSNITAEYYLNITNPPYVGYDYAELFNDGASSLNGTLVNNAGGCASVERFDTYNLEEQMLHFNVDAQGGNRRATFTLNKAISYAKKLVVEFDWYSNSVTGGGAGDEGQLSFRNGTGANNDVFTLYNKRSGDDGFGDGGIGIAVGSLNGTDNSRRAHTIDASYRAHLSDAAAASWYHVKVEIYKGHRIAFTFTGIDNQDYVRQVVLPIPAADTHGSITNIFFNATRTGNVTWNTWIDNIGIKVVDEDVPATGVSISGYNNVASGGGVITLTAAVLPWEVTDHSVTWSVSNPELAAIAPSPVASWIAVLTSLGDLENEGSLVVTATSGAASGTRTISVGQVPLDSVRIDGARAADTAPKEVSVNNTITLTAEVWPENAGNKDLVWTSSNANIATVDPSTGEVTGVAEGNAVITAAAADGSGKTDTCNVKVIFTKITKVDLQGARRLFYTATPTATPPFTVVSAISPSTASVKTLNFTSLNPEVATVTDNGNGTATVALAGAFGKARIKATTDDESGVVGYYTLEVADESPYQLFTDFEKGVLDSTFNLTTDATANVSAFEESYVSYFNANNQSGGRSVTLALKNGDIGGDIVELRFDWYAGNPAGKNGDNINNGLFSVRNPGGYSIITFGFINADDDEIKPLSYFTGEPGSDAFPFADAEKAKRVNLSGVSNLDTWYTINLTISYYKMKLDFTITERDNEENTQTVTNIPIPEENYQPYVRGFNVAARRVSGANVTITSCLDNFGYNTATYEFVKITFDPDEGRFADGSEEPKTETVIKNTTFAEQVPADPSKTGFDFTGWAYSDKTPYQTSDVRSVNDTLYAQWEVKKLQVNILRNVGDTVEVRMVDYNTRINPRPATPTLEGFEFEAWWNHATGAVWNFNTLVTSKMTLIAKWIGVEVAIPTEPGEPGGSGEPTEPTEPGGSGEPTEPTEPTEPGGSGEPTEPTEPTEPGGSGEPTTVYYTVKFVNEGDTIPYQVKAGETVDLPVEPARNGYFFGGWYNGETEWNFNAAVNANLILTAKWTTGQTFVASGVLSGVALYPNPVSNAVTVTGLTGSETIELFSVSGALVLSRKASSDKAVIGAAGLSSGAYLVRITRGSASKQLKLIKN